MKLFFTLFFLLTVIITVNAQESNTYDPELAKELGADDYGMKMYVFVLLKTGSSEIENKAVRDSLFSGHLSNIGRLTEEGKLIVAGPLGRNENNYRGIFIFDAPLSETDSLLQTDPAINANLLEAEIYPWYGSAALPVYLETHSKIEKSKP